jgi:hypothetical protein
LVENHKRFSEDALPAWELPGVALEVVVPGLVLPGAAAGVEEPVELPVEAATPAVQVDIEVEAATLTAGVAPVRA